MKNHKLRLFYTCCVLLFSLSARADYMVNFPVGYTAFANHLDHPGGNRAGLIFSTLQDGMVIFKWDGAVFVPYTYDTVLGWDPSDPVVDPGEGAFLFTPVAFSNTFTGAAHTPSLPVEMVPGMMYFLSDQTAQVGSWQSIVGTSPIEGSQVFVYNVASQSNITNYDGYAFHQGAWQPSTPSVPIGVSAFFSVPLLAPGWVTREFYLDVNTNNAGGGIADLLADAKYPTHPNLSNEIMGFQINNDFPATNYGVRVQAYFTPSVSGVYEFFVYNDDAARLFLSTNDLEANLQLLIDSPSVQTTFDTSAMGTSPALTAGQNYLLRALFRQNSGGAHLGVGVRLQGNTTPPASLPVLGGDQLSTIVYPAHKYDLTFQQQPASTNCSVGKRARFSVQMTSTAPRLYYQWLLNGVAIPNADRPTYVTPTLSISDNGNVYQVQVSAGGATRLSLPAYLGVVPGPLPQVQPYVGVHFLSAVAGSVADETVGLLRTNDVAGVVEQENFNNLSDLKAVSEALVDSHGNATPVTISYGPVSHGASGSGASDANRALFQGYIQNANSSITLTLSNIPPTTNYSLLVYSMGVATNATYEEAFTLTGQTTYPTLHVRAEDAGQYLAAPAYAGMSSTDPGHRDVGNYVQFDSVTPAADGTLVLVVTPESPSLGSPPLPPVNALQLVTVQPAPIRPNLSMTYVGASQLLTIGWDATATGYALESTRELGVNAAWSPVLGLSIPLTNAGSVSLSTTSNPSTFYGLIQKGYPFIIQQPKSQTVQVGTTNVSFSVIATGAPPITYQWTFNGVNISNATSSIYVIPHAVTFADVGDYRVFINDPIGSLPAGLTVYTIGASGGALETPISQFTPAGNPCTGGGQPLYNRTYVPHDTANNVYLFYGPKASPQPGIFANTAHLSNVDVDLVSSVNTPVSAIVAVQNNWPWYTVVRCNNNPAPLALSQQSGSWTTGSMNSYFVTLFYQSPPDPSSQKVRFNWNYE